MSRDVRRVNEMYDNQIKFDKNYKVHKALFELTQHLTFEDWAIIRSEEYWETADKLKEREKKMYILSCVKEYCYNKRNY